MEPTSLKRKLGRVKQSQTIKGSGNPHWKGGKATKYCIMCSSPFQVYPSGLSREYCSIICHNKDLNEKRIGSHYDGSKKRGKNNPWYGKGYLRKGELCYNWLGDKLKFTCLQCGKEFRSHTKTHKFCSKVCSTRWHFTKEKNPAWKGGITSQDKIIRSSSNFYNWRDFVYKRDNYTCQRCGHRGGLIHAHHIKLFVEYPELRLVVGNGITYCEPCHRYIHSRQLLIDKIKKETQSNRIALLKLRIKTLYELNTPELIKNRKLYLSYMNNPLCSVSIPRKISL